MHRIAPPETLHETPHAVPPLACVVAGPDGEHATRLTALLGRSARVGDVERAGSEVVLRHALAVRHRDLVVVVLDAPDRLLPASLLRYPDTRVLVVAPDGVRGTLSRWLQQGANDLVSPHDEDALAHALGRLVDECALVAAARRLDTLVAAQRRRIEILTARLEAGERRVGPVAASLPTPSLSAPARVGAACGPGEADEGADELDPASRLPTRTPTLAALERLRTAPGSGAGHETGHGGEHEGGRPEDEPDARLTALQVVLPAGSVHDRLDRTLTDLAVCRAAEVLRGSLPGLLVLGRTRRDTLLAVCTGDPEAIGGQHAAARIATRLGSLGELVERAGDVRVDAIGGTVDAIATAALAERLERRAHQGLVASAALAAGDEGTGSVLGSTGTAERSGTASGEAWTGSSAHGDDGRDGRVVREEPGRARRDAPADGRRDDASLGGTRAATRYIGERGDVAEPRLDDSLVPILTQKSASARFARPAAGA